jgi:hypothetical protein
MANAALVLDNNAEGGRVTASTQALTMPASNLLTPHPSQRWRSLSGAASLVIDKGAASAGDAVGLFGLTGSSAMTARLRLSSIDATGAAGDVTDTGALASGGVNFDVKYGAFLYLLPAPASYRYLRFDLNDAGASFVEAGCILDGLKETFTYNFVPGGTVQWVDRSRIAGTSSGKTLTWQDNKFRRANLSFETVTTAQRDGLIERLDRDKGKTKNVLLILDTASDKLARDAIYGLVSDPAPIAFGRALDVVGNPLFAKQFRIDERI